MNRTKKYYSHGKLMLTGEYLVLKGARSLALATSLGQHLSVIETDSNSIEWTSIDQNDEIWFDAHFSLPTLEIINATDKKRALFLASLLAQIENLNPDFVLSLKGLRVETKLEFDPEWGLGSSSTLIRNLASWAEVSPFELLRNTLGGSGYDIAVAETGAHVLYNRLPQVDYKVVVFNPPFKDSIHFVYLNKKQDSAKAVKEIQALSEKYSKEIEQINTLTERILKVETLSEFEQLLAEHNRIMSAVLNQKSAQEQFPNYTGGVLKYLGAWGGDFMLATGSLSDMNFFKSEGFGVVLSFDSLIKDTQL